MLVCVYSAVLAIPAHAEFSEPSETSESSSASDIEVPIFDDEQGSADDLESVETPVSSLEDDVHAIRTYIEFSLFLLLPLVLAILLFSLGCWWFYRTFIRY